MSKLRKILQRILPGNNKHLGQEINPEKDWKRLFVMFAILIVLSAIFHFILHRILTRSLPQEINTVTRTELDETKLDAIIDSFAEREEAYEALLERRPNIGNP